MTRLAAAVTAAVVLVPPVVTWALERPLLAALLAGVALTAAYAWKYRQEL